MSEMTITEAFDRQFGTDGPERDSDSAGRGAGCDDCSRSIEVRAEHRRFVVDAIAAIRSEEHQTRQALVDALKGMVDDSLDEHGDDHHDGGCPRCALIIQARAALKLAGEP